jgi:hypothetical protein
MQARDAAYNAALQNIETRKTSAKSTAVGTLPIAADSASVTRGGRVQIRNPRFN